MRKIAAGINDCGERGILLEMANEYEKMGWNTQQDPAFGVPERDGL
jgi:hypothetical protein